MNLDDIKKEIFSKLILKKKKLDILFIGCGFSDEVLFFIKNYGKNHNIYAQDISKLMVQYSAKLLKNYNVNFDISSAESLPYRNNCFDLVFHFGGLISLKIKKMYLRNE